MKNKNTKKSSFKFFKKENLKISYFLHGKPELTYNLICTKKTYNLIYKEKN